MIHKHVVISSGTRSVYQAICYFDIFNYPLKFSEIHKFCSEKISEESLNNALDELLKLKKIQFVKDYYFLQGGSYSAIDIRIENEINLTRRLSRIKKYAKLVSSFPFVRAAFISGSVSKGVLDREGDVDYFIVSEKGRVWLCRTLLILFKKVFLFNSKKYFCVNYFVDTMNLNVPDSNLFVATEIKTLIPVFENEYTMQFRKANEWANEMFPNLHDPNRALLSESSKQHLPGKVIEKICSSSFGNKLDNYFFRKTLQRWQKKFPDFDKAQFDLNMRSYKNVSKHHPQGNQAKVLNALALRMRKLDQ